MCLWDWGNAAPGRQMQVIQGRGYGRDKESGGGKRLGDQGG